MNIPHRNNIYIKYMILTRKKELKQKENQEYLSSTISMLHTISNTPNIKRNTRNIINKVITMLEDKKDDNSINNSSSMSVRAANAISSIEEMLQHKQTESHIRTMLWQVLSFLEKIRE